MKFIWLILTIIYFTAFALADEKSDKQLSKLVLRAEVLESKIDKSDEKFPRCNLKLKVTFTNEGDKSFIILHSLDKENYGGNYDWIGGVSISAINRYGDYGIFSRIALPSVCRNCYKEIQKELNQKTPPEKYAKILKPKELWTFIDEQSFSLPNKTQSYGYGWNEVENSNWKLHGWLLYSLLPNNLDEKFRTDLRKRWRKYGLLYYDGTHSVITSEKFDIDLSSLKF